MNHSASSTAASNVAPPQPKPIRFVTNHDGPYAKRRRINSACLTCRRRKTRCSGERPVCGTCSQNKHDCGGYGPETDNHTSFSPTAEDSKEGIKRSLQGDGSSNPSPIRSPVKKSRPPPPTQPSRPSISHTISSDSMNSQASESSANKHTRRHGNDIALSLSTRNRMPYFRYFGPTAIMPGFKQMVVKVRGKQHGTGQTSSDPLESSPGQPPSIGQISPSNIHEARTPLEIPVYDTSAMSPSPLITHLCQIFFLHLGCNFPFLQRERFMRDLEEKQVDAILVDAVCALAARFSTHPMLTGTSEPQKDKEAPEASQLHPSEYGQAFAQRAKSAIPDTFPCPSVAVVQAALLLAYDEFGASRDSGLWMYLGISIRMSQDLGMQTFEGLKYEGRNGPTPKSVKSSPSNGNNEGHNNHAPHRSSSKTSEDPAIQEQRAVERERVDTFWAIFFLDRVISSGTGRPVTLRDRDIEISFPSLDEVDSVTGWPVPFPALIRIIHLYGRVTDLLNSIKEVSHVTPDVIKRLAAMENHLTDIYQGLSPKLHFNAVNFQHYVKANQGTNFVLLHFWFHTLIVLLHQPTLLKTFEGSIQQLLPNSRELSMSSAKTIADILAFAELIDAKSGLGNPFTSQPIYIAACAFLKESALHSASSNPHSRPSTPGSRDGHDSGLLAKSSMESMKLDKHYNNSSNGDRSSSHLSDHSLDQKQAAKHTLLASAANQNYQRCYRALKSLETYWAGVKYILTVLDQKAKGVGDPLLYTREEMESALELPRPEPAFTSPGWRRKLSWGTYLTAQNIGDAAHAKVTSALRQKKGGQTVSGSASPIMNPAQAIGWSLTGTMNSPSTSLAVLYPTDTSREPNAHHPSEAPTPSIASILSRPKNHTSLPNPSNRIKYETPHSIPSSSSNFASTAPSQQFNPAHSTITSMPPPPTNFHSLPTADPSLVSDADLLLNLHSPFSNSSPGRMPTGTSPYSTSYRSSTISSTQTPSHDFSSGSSNQFPSLNVGPGADGSSQVPFGDMMIESQDIDMSALGDDMMPWLEYLPHDMLNLYDPGAGFVGDGGVQGQDMESTDTIGGTQR